MKNFIFIFILILLSCVRNSTLYNFDSYLSCSDTLAAEKLESELFTTEYPKLHDAGTRLIATSELKHGFIQLIDKQSGKVITSMGNIGRGPDELISPSGQHFNRSNNKLYISDNYLKKLFIYKITNDSIELIDKLNIPTDFFLNRFKSINDSLFVAINYYPHQSIHLLNNKWDTINKISYKSFDNPEITQYENNKRDNIMMDIMPDKKLIIIADSDMPLIKAYSYHNNQLKLVWEKMLDEPYYLVKNGWREIQDNQRNGFINMSVTDDYIYLLSTGKTYGEWIQAFSAAGKGIEYQYLMTFDYKGNHLKSIYLKNPMYNLTVTSKNNSIHGINFDGDKILRYSLNNGK